MRKPFATIKARRKINHFCCSAFRVHFPAYLQCQHSPRSRPDSNSYTKGHLGWLNRLLKSGGVVLKCRVEDHLASHCTCFHVFSLPELDSWTFFMLQCTAFIRALLTSKPKKKRWRGCTLCGASSLLPPASTNGCYFKAKFCSLATTHPSLPRDTRARLLRAEKSHITHTDITIIIITSPAEQATHAGTYQWDTHQSLIA